MHPAAPNGHSDGVHTACGNDSRLSTGMLSPAAQAPNDDPSVTSVPTTTGRAAQTVRSSIVPRTADPALMTSLTTATRLPRTVSRRTRGSRVLDLEQHIR